MAIPKGTRTVFQADREWHSERSDAGNSIVPKAFAFVNGKTIRSEAEAGCRWQEKGCGERGSGSLPRFNNGETRRASARRLSRATFLTHGFSAHFNAMCVVNQAVEDAISGRRLADLFVPACDGEL